MSADFDLDLDLDKNIRKYECSINTNFRTDTIYKLIELVRNHGNYLGMIEYYGIDAYQYSLKVKYLNKILPVVFEHDCTYQHIYILLYNEDRSKTHLKIYLSVVEDPMIKYIEKDTSGIYSGCHGLKSGEFLINFAHCFVNFIGFNRMRLDDDSRVGQAKLWLFHLITKGKSWYSKFGYYPAGVSEYELQTRINGIQEIKLNEIMNTILLVIENEENPELCKIYSELKNCIENCEQTMEEYCKTHTIEEFATFTNLLFSRAFSKKYNVCEREVSFEWFSKLGQLHLGNIQQVNNCIGNFYLKI